MLGYKVIVKLWAKGLNTTLVLADAGAGDCDGTGAGASGDGTCAGTGVCACDSCLPAVKDSKQEKRPLPYDKSLPI